MTIIEIDSSTIVYLDLFIKNEFPSTFRYFNNKTSEQIIKNHYKTVLYIDNNIPVGYAHIDYDIVNDKYWFGMCVISSHQKKGIGKKLIEIILEYYTNSNIDVLYLTVDKENTIAYNLYLKNGFKTQRETNNIYIMNLVKTNILYLPVSYGEAIDKLTILDIKMNKIIDSRRYDVEIEYNKLQSELKYIIQSIIFYYNALKNINLAIWEDQDTFRYSTNTDEKTNICMKIIEDNDARFRIKNKINYILNSHLKEQKGYNLKVFTINYSSDSELNTTLNSIIKYQSIFNDKVIINCNKDVFHMLQSYFKYDPSIEIVIQSTIDISDTHIQSLESNIHNKSIYNFIKNFKVVY
jgi:GNAT superfamily N-acetyltransferase